MLVLGLEEKLPNFRVDLTRLPDAAERTLAATLKAYPSLDVPFHSRWRHFVFEGVDRWAGIDHATTWPNTAARARSAFDLAIVSVLLDAGAGPEWRYRDPTSGKAIGRSEGLALASLDMFSSGAFSSDRAKPLQADAEELIRLSAEAVREGFQVYGRQSACRRRRPHRSAAPAGCLRCRKSGSLRPQRLTAVPAVFSIISPRWRPTRSFRRLRFCPSCCVTSARSGHRV